MFNLITAADVTPREFSDWYVFNTWLQRVTEKPIHLHIPVSFNELHQAINSDNVDIIYANPYDAAMLVRDNNFVPIVRADNQGDEVVIVTQKDNPISSFTDLSSGCRIALTDDKDVKMLGMILIEPADLNVDNVSYVDASNGVVVAKKVINNEADIGFILTKAYDVFSPLITDALRILIRSEISVMNHILMAKPHVIEAIPNLSQLLSNMHTTAVGQSILNNFGINEWLPVEQEEVEFMIDLMDTLK